MQAVLLGIDLGSSSVKVIAIDPDGRLLAGASRPYRNFSPGNGYVEQDPAEWWEQAAAAVRECIATVSSQTTDFSVEAIGLTGQMHTFVCLDRDGAVVRPAITWMDGRGGRLAQTVARRADSDALMAVIRNPVVSGMTLVSLLWMKQNEPQLLERTSVIVHAKDWARYRLTGTLGSDHTDASATLLFDQQQRGWSAEICAAFELPYHVLPPLSRSWEQVGKLTRHAATELGLPDGIPVAAGAADQQAAAVGNRVIEPLDMQLMMGTGAQVFSACGRLPAHYSAGMNTFCHVRDWALQGSVQNAGLALGWVCRTLGLSWDELFACSTALAAGSPVFVPYLTGERSPEVVHQPSGAWIGMSSSSTRIDLAAAAIEGVAFSIAQSVKQVREQSAADRTTLIRCSGGGTRSDPFVQLIADLVELPLARMNSVDASAHGAALLGGVAAGVYAGLEQAVEHAGLLVSAQVDPDAQTAGRLAKRLERVGRIRAQVLAIQQ